MVTEERNSLLIKVPSELTVIFLSSPYWLRNGYHQSGLYLPGRSPKSPGLVHVPSSVPFSENVISDGQLLFTEGHSEQSSKESVK